MEAKLTDSRLEAYLDEALSEDELAAVERSVRQDPAAVARLAEIRQLRDAGQHSLGAIWRRHRLTCPPRSRLGSYLLGVVEAEEATGIRLHIEVLGCAFCRANLEDLQREHDQQDRDQTLRRRKFFDSSAGLLRGK